MKTILLDLLIVTIAILALLEFPLTYLTVQADRSLLASMINIAQNKESEPLDIMPFIGMVLCQTTLIVIIAMGIYQNL